MKTLLALLLLIPSLSWGLDQDEIKEQLKYWKSLLDDDLINQEDYDKQKEKLINRFNNKNIDKAEEITKVDEDKNNKIDNTSEDFITTLSENQLRRVQDYLGQLGLYKGSIDGLLGPKTISAMKTWMKSKNNFNNIFETKDYSNLQYDINLKKQKKLEQLELNKKAEIKQRNEPMKTYCLGPYYYTTYSSCFNDDKQITKNEFDRHYNYTGEKEITVENNSNSTSVITKNSESVSSVTTKKKETKKKKKKYETAEEKALRKKRADFLMILGGALMDGEGVAGGLKRYNNKNSSISNKTNNSYQTTCFLETESTEGFNKICIYDCVGTPYAINLDSPTKLCPLTINK